ncbi:MAG: hypothetical protein KAI47_26410, partial [Deltaproteobacteria bacterium]|nr:hypothetical protein [Deltaproteobacteria bacterium]
MKCNPPHHRNIILRAFRVSPLPLPSWGTTQRAILRGGLFAFALTALVIATGCSDDGSNSGDSGIGDAPITEAGVKLWPCSNPGRACNAHDTCALDAICGTDGWCRPQGFQDCDDGLDCTDDTCGGNGLCVNTPKEGFCALLVTRKTGGSEERCFKVNDISPSDPCRVCNPKVAPRKWSGREGGSCDDDNPCTVNDVCKGGFCEGNYYGNRCNDLLICTKDVCDGKGGCSNTLESNTCLIKGVCHKQGEASADGCARCDPTKDQHAWTPLTSLCRIGAHCYAGGSFDSTGCGICDPTANDKGWSLAPKTCVIDGACLKAGDADATGCATCDPKKSTSVFTPAADKCVIGGVCYAKDALGPGGCGRCDPATSAAVWT